MQWEGALGEGVGALGEGVRVEFACKDVGGVGGTLESQSCMKLYQNDMPSTPPYSGVHKREQLVVRLCLRPPA